MKIIEYNLQYDSEGKITKLNISGGLTINYFYQNGILVTTEELNILGDLKERIYYTFEQNRLKTKVKEIFLPVHLPILNTIMSIMLRVM